MKITDFYRLHPEIAVNAERECEMELTPEELEDARSRNDEAKLRAYIKGDA